MKGLPVRRRFVYALLLYTALILTLWFGYYTLAYRSVSNSAKENAELAALRLLDQVSAEFSQMYNIAGVIAGSASVRDFLSSSTSEEFYNKVQAVEEIIRTAAYPISLVDSVVTINTWGDYYRFTGSLSNAACESLHEKVRETGNLHAIIALDGNLFFCHAAAVYSFSGQAPGRVGTVILLTNLNRTRKALTEPLLSGADMAVIQDDIILLSNIVEIEGKHEADVESAYAVVSRKAIDGTNLSIAAAIQNEALFPNRALFLLTSFLLLALLLIAVIALYRYLSGYIVRPMASVIGGVAALGGDLSGRLPEMPALGKPDFQALVLAINGLIGRGEQYGNELTDKQQKLFAAEILQRDMRIGLLISQIDAHFVVNAVKCIQTLALRGDSERAGEMADGLARIIKHRHTGDALCNLFVEFEMIEKYVALMNIRHDGKFSAEYDVDDRLTSHHIPGLVLQPVVENALTHGLQNKEVGAVLHIRGFASGDAVVLEVSDNGSGIAPVKLKSIQNMLETIDIEGFPDPGLSGVSLSNIQRRIRLRFGGEYGLAVDSVLGERESTDHRENRDNRFYGIHAANAGGRFGAAPFQFPTP